MSDVGPSPMGSAAPAAGVLHGATVCLRAELGQARVLARSFLGAHPGGSFTILVADAGLAADSGSRGLGGGAAGFVAGSAAAGLVAGARAGGGAEGAGLETWGLADLDTGSRPPESIVRPASIVAPEDPATAGRSALPWLAATLLDRGRSPLLVLDAATFVLRTLDPLADAAGRSGAAFVARLIDSSVAHHSAAATEEVLAAGVIDPGIVALVDGVGSRSWLAWWKSLDVAVPGNRRAFDLAPAFGHAVVRDPGIGLSKWNLHERRVQAGPDGLTAGGSPLRTVSFAGLLVPAESPSRLRWSDDPSTPIPAYEPGEPLYELASDYAAAVAALSD